MIQFVPHGETPEGWNAENVAVRAPQTESDMQMLALRIIDRFMAPDMPMEGKAAIADALESIPGDEVLDQAALAVLLTKFLDNMNRPGIPNEAKIALTDVLVDHKVLRQAEHRWTRWKGPML